MKKRLSLLLTFSLLLITLCAPVFTGAAAAPDMTEYPDLETYQSPKTFVNDPASPQHDSNLPDLGTAWTYEYVTGTTPVFTAMDRTEAAPGTNAAPPADGTVVYQQPQVDGTPTADAIAALRCFWKSLYLSPGTEAGIVQTFVVPKDGVIEVDATTIVRNYGGNDVEADLTKNIKVAVYLNDQKVWPAQEDWKTVSWDSGNNKQDVEKLTGLTVKKGDKLRFVVNTGDGANWNDNTQWPVTVNLYSKKGAAPDLSNYTLKGAYTSPAYFISDEKSQFNDAALKDLDTVWTYEYANSHSGVFTAMTRTDKKPGTEAAPPADGTVVYQQPQYNGAPAADAIAALRCNWKTLFLSPGTQWDISQTFVAPGDGVIEVDPATIVRNSGNDDADVKGKIEVAIYLNRTKIWPAGKDWAVVSRDSDTLNKLAVEKLSGLTVRKGDKLRFVVGSGAEAKVNWGDNTQWPVTVKFYSEGGAPSSQPGTSSQGSASSQTGSGTDDSPKTGAASPLAAAAAVMVAGGALAMIPVIRRARKPR